MRVRILLILAALSMLPIASSCVSGEAQRGSDAVVAARDYILKNCKKFDISTAHITEENYGDQVVIEFMPRDFREEIEEDEKDGYVYIPRFDPEILFMFNKKPLKMTHARGCEQYS
ncbi:hypothetical protein QFZ27_001666 [Inquilinus ginsengisoli]|uniref:hypothetical protein n=1 Tax=Inquilinus ginsengisoli TaxID=363840 RepID=UPI003D1CF590